MDNIIGIIIFLIISSIISGGKNKKKPKKTERPSEIKTFMEDVRESIQIGMDNRKTASQTSKDEGLKSNELKQKYKNKIENKKNIKSRNIQKNQRDEIYKESNTLNQNRSISQNNDAYARENKNIHENIYSTNEKEINRISPYSKESKPEKEKFFSDKEDLRKAIILKEILDKPLSLRK